MNVWHVSCLIRQVSRSNSFLDIWLVLEMNIQDTNFVIYFTSSTFTDFD